MKSTEYEVSFDMTEIDEDIVALFTFNGSPTPEMIESLSRIREVTMLLAQVIRDNTPICARQTIALQHVVDARMSANAAVATNGANFERK